MTERDYLLAATIARAGIICDALRGITPVKGVVAARDMRALGRIASKWANRAHAAIDAALGGK